ncbi:MAG: HAMP domain-containing sensor histidine kinase [Pseudomonadota bacterium]
MTVIFVLLAEVVVMIPSISKQRLDWIDARMEAAYLVSAALEGPRGRMISEEDARLLFRTAGIRGVTVKRGDVRSLILAPEIDPHGSTKIYRVDSMDRMPLTLIANAWATMFSSGDALIQISGPSRANDAQSLDIIVAQADLRRDLRIYARNILGLSLVISTLTGLLLFYAFNRLIVAPVKRLTNDMAAFEADPDHAANIHVPSGRIDEIGAAERSLAMMQRRINELLGERRRLAALGAGISKISHDLRNILASAQLMSDRLAKSEDPAVRKLSPRLINALDRAITLSRDTLAFGAMEPSKLDRNAFALNELATEVLEDTAARYLAGENLVPADLIVFADRTHLYRSLFNLARNAAEAMAPADSDETDINAGAERNIVRIRARQDGEDVVIWLEDTGPGLPEHARADLFEPFKGSQKPGGSGLGVAISAEIINAHGGEIVLERSDESGAVFRIRLPDAVHQRPPDSDPVEAAAE